MNQPDYDSDDECVCGSDAGALGYCKVHYTLLTLSQIAELLEQESSDYSKGLKDIITLLVYTKAQSEIYQNKSTETLNILTNFKKNLVIDRSNFQLDRDFLLNATTIEQSKLSEVIKHAIEANKAIDAIDTIIKQIDQTRH